MLAPSATQMDLRALEEELKKLGISIVSSRQDTVIAIRIKGLAGKALDRGIRLCDQLLQEKVKNVLKMCTDSSSKLFVDPTFGPTAADPNGASAFCKTGTVIPSKGGSQHQMKMLSLLKADKLRWERPEYADEEDAADEDNNRAEDTTDDADTQGGRNCDGLVFATQAKLFSDGVCSGDVIQGNLGDCWFLSALSVVATRSDLLEQTFWRGDKHRSKGLFVCRFMKNFVWNYVIVDDRIPVYGFSKTKSGKPYFARCRDPNELWVALLEKAYAKLHGSYESLIGGFVDVALNDLTGMCSEQVILKSGFPGFGEDPFAPAKPQQKRGEPFWEKILRYKSSGTLMGCSIQPAPTSADKNAAAESSAGNGLYFKHAYALVDASEVKTVRNEMIKLIKLRNPWGMGEWTGPWSDSSEERIENRDVIERYFKILKRKVGGNLNKRIFLSLNGKGELMVDEISQEEVVEVNANDGTFFMSFDAWIEYFTHFFAGIDFPDEWHGRRVEGCWNESTCGGNTAKSTWINNPRFEFVVHEQSQFFISLSQEDPRGKENLKIVPIGFHICSLTPLAEDKGGKCEIKEPPGKEEAYYRLYKEKDRLEYKKGVRAEPLPPAIIPGSVVKAFDEDGVPQPAYTFKQAVSVDVTMNPGKYCIIPSLYMRTDKDTGKTNVGNFWISVYSNKAKFSLEGGERIAEEEEGEEDESGGGNNTPTRKSIRTSVRSSHLASMSSPGKGAESSITTESVSVIDRRRRFEDAKEELLAHAKTKGIGLRELKMEFAKAGAMKKLDLRKKMLTVGFKPDELSDEKLNVIFSGLDVSSKGTVEPGRVLNLFEAEIHEDQMACDVPEVEDDEVPQKVHDEGVLCIELRGARDLPPLTRKTHRSNSAQRKMVRFEAIEYNASEKQERKQSALSICAKNEALACSIRPILKRFGWLSSSVKPVVASSGLVQFAISNPVQYLIEEVEKEVGSARGDAVRRATLRDQELLGSAAISTFQSSLHTITINGSMSSLLSSAVDVAPKLPHRSSRMQTLEEKRSRRLSDLRRRKQEALGDRCKAASLPRLIGGRKSGSSYVQCSDCDRRVLVSGRAGERDDTSRSSQAPTPESFICSGARCFNALCAACYLSLPIGKKVCEDCYEHELSPLEVFGSHLRAALIEKMGYSKDHQLRVEEYFRSIDKDQSGALSYGEFSSALSSLGIEPPLTNDQLQTLLTQFDTNKDGEISLNEFKDWIFTDQVWQPNGVVAPSATPTHSVTHEALSTVIQPALESILDSAFEALLVASSTTQWVTTSNTVLPHSVKAQVKSTAQIQEMAEQGSLVFQRVQTIKMATSAGGSDTEGSVDQIFERFDKNGSGKIDSNEFSELLESLGMSFPSAETVLLMRRVELSGSVNETIDLTEFRSYAESLTSSPAGMPRKGSVATTLVHKLLEIDSIAASDGAKRESLQEITRQFHYNIKRSTATELSGQYRRRTGLIVSVEEIQRLSNAFHFREVVPITSAQSRSSAQASADTSPRDGVSDLNNSGDVLGWVLFDRSDLLQPLLRGFKVQAVCTQIAIHLEIVMKTKSPDGIWKTLYGTTTTSDPVDQRFFVDKLLQTGFCVSGDSSDATTRRLATKTIVALVLDALRAEVSDNKANDAWSWAVSYNLFVVLMRRQQIDTIEMKFAHALRSYLTFSQGNQSYLIDVALEADNIVVRASDPVRKYMMDFVLRPQDYNTFAVAQLGETVWPRTRVNTNGGRRASHVRGPMGLTTEATHPLLHRGLVSLLSRLRISTQSSMSAQHFMTPFLTLFEDHAFVQTLEGMFARARLPFFWSISPTTLEFSIDGDYLSQVKRITFHQFIAETLTVKPAAKALRSLLKFTDSSLKVRYETVGQNAVFDSSWSDFQALLSGHQNTFAVVEMRPRGDAFVTKVDRTGGNGAPKWNFSQQIVLKEPERVEYRLDMPVVYSDTVRVSSIPDGNSSSRISFIALRSGANGSAASKAASTSGHFVVLSVRKALPEKRGDKTRLYCTAYDPFTSSDFAVEGYPADWPLDFFNQTVHPDYEARWLDILKGMYLGPGLTPKMLIKVFSKHAKVEKLLGECEISVATAITHEGHIFDDWFPLLHPSDPSQTTGSVNLTFHFDSKKLSELAEENKEQKRVPLLKDIASKSVEERPPSVAPPKQENQRLEQLEKALELAEQSKRDALEQAQKLKTQLLLQAESATNAASVTNGEVSRWKSKLEQARREQEADQSEHERRVAALRAEIEQLREEQRQREAESKPETQQTAHVVPTNLHQASLGDGAAALDILFMMKEILVSRSPNRPFNGLKKAMAAIAEIPGKVSVAAFDEVLDDFGLGLSTAHRRALLSVLDPEAKGRVSIEEFFNKLSGDVPAPATPPRPIQLSDPLPMQIQDSPPRPVSSNTLPTKPHKMSWKEMRKFLALNLPEGWEMRYTDKGRPYFCNHANRSTHWKHPVPEVDTKFTEWVKEHGANFSRASSATMPGRK